jgi:2-octaprenyl-6-methoxyphenol hydroxylase
MRSHDADVIIAGAGMAGSTLALALHSGGLKPLLVDPQPFDAQVAPTFDGRASAIAFAAFRQWRTIGARRRLRPARPAHRADPGHRRPHAGRRGPGASAGLYLRFDSARSPTAPTASRWAT